MLFTGMVMSIATVSLRSLVLIVAMLSARSLRADAPAMQIPDDFPQFLVPGHDREMHAMRELFWLHYQPAGPLITLWDEWMPMSTLWPAVGPQRGAGSMHARWTAALAGRGMNSDGYVHTHQHDGPAHAQGWPFPMWMQAGGVGWHFAGTGVAGYDAPLVKPDNWQLTNARGGTINERGWQIELTAPSAAAQPPAFDIDARSAPFLRLNWWADGLDGANCWVEWTTKDQPQFSPDRRAYFTPSTSNKVAVGETRTMIEMYRLPGWSGRITGLRIHFDNPGPAKLTIKSIHTACDTRHNINNPNFVRGCCDVFAWTGDVTFLREQIDRIRKAMRFTMSEFDTRRRKCVYTTWVGHEGRSGVRWTADGKKQVIPNEGIGSNYWDILPFGGEDALATIYYYDALLDLANLEEAIANHPEWNVSRGADAFDPADLRKHAAEVKACGQKRFWNDKTGRFGTVDLDGVLHDYGFTFLNNEAIYYDFASPAQAKSIESWMSGERIVEGDTATGPDIYHWRFGPRSTTKRNLDYYFWGWSNPESISFGYQVQDGGAVLGWSYHDLMARLKTRGPDDAWKRLREIATWFDETQAAGGYRAYYSDPSRGTMQGANVAGGLGLDKEFFESVLVPQVMLYGFLGFHPDRDGRGFTVEPKLPGDWPKLTITRIRVGDAVVDVTATSEGVKIDGLPADSWRVENTSSGGAHARRGG
jgi:hypothetical protein